MNNVLIIGVNLRYEHDGELCTEFPRSGNQPGFVRSRLSFYVFSVLPSTCGTTAAKSVVFLSEENNIANQTVLFHYLTR